MSTALGKILKTICIQTDTKQMEMAKKLGISDGKLSEIITGKAVPDMDLLGKCIDQYQVKGKEIRDLFSSAFSGTAENNHTIVLDTRHFSPDRIDMLIKVITVLLLDKDLHQRKGLESAIKNCYECLDGQVKYSPPPQEENNSTE
ncbi:hypothetical protein FACS1894110_02360 [Spirochaetia bacterium]|nr:hypothetical protein FACS1894110_02360 [Spirochaetia bacterium]